MTQAPQRASVLIGASWYLIEKMTRLLVAFLIGAWVARYLGPESYGALAYALALVAVIGFLGSLGIESLVVRDLVHGTQQQRQVISTYFFVRLTGAIGVPLLAIGYLLITHANDHLLMLLAVLCSGSILFGSFDVADCWLQSQNKARETSVIRVTGFIGGALLRCMLIFMDASVQWFAVAVFMESAVVAALYFRLLRRHQLAPAIKDFSLTEFRRLVIDGKWMVLSGLIVTIYSKIDVLAIGALLSNEVLGGYAIAASMCGAWNMVGMSLVQAWAPRISQAKANCQADYVAALRQLLIGTLAISLLGSFILSLIAEWIFHLLLGAAYQSGAVVFSKLIWSSVFVFLGVATSQIIVNEKIYWISLARTASGLTFSLMVMDAVASNWGADGVAWMMVANAALATLSIFFSRAARTTIKLVLKWP